MIEFKLNRLIEYSDEEIIREIRRVASIVQRPTLTGKDFEKEARVSRGVVNKHFGGWRQALEAAGLPHLYAGQKVTDNMRAQKHRGITDDGLLSELRRISSMVQRKDISIGDVRKHSEIDRDVYRRRFGSFAQAVNLAGLTTRTPGAGRIVHTMEDLFANLYEVWVHHGRQPHYSEMSKPPSRIKSKNYTNRFGTWRNALQAFIRYTEDGCQSESVEFVATPKEAGSRSEVVISRHIPLRVRFNVMRRDNFRCVLCGNSPPLTPGLVLHVDHVIPWSKGGKALPDNLRTLCADCNIGRSNLYDD